MPTIINLKILRQLRPASAVGPWKKKVHVGRAAALPSQASPGFLLDAGNGVPPAAGLLLDDKRSSMAG